jgi:hypothetical protein
MTYNWDYVKQTTLWPYEDLLKKLGLVLAYPLIQEVYNHSMRQADAYARRLFPAQNIAAGEFPAPLLASLERLQGAGIQDWSDLLARVATRASLEAFIEHNELAFEELIDVLRYLLRSALPFYTATRELLDHDDPQEMAAYAAFKHNKLMCSFDLLQRGHTVEGRHSLARETGLPLDFVTAIVHRADIARLPYVRRKTILPVCGAGYDTLAKIAAADLPRMEADMQTHFQHAKGKDWGDFKSVILLRGLVDGARALPKILVS